MASFRYRASIPAKQIGAQVNNGEADCVVFAKPMHADLETAHKIKKEGVKIVVDFCDNHFEHQEYGPLYKAMAEIADKITCASEVMRDEIKNHGFDSEVIADPYEFGLNEPHANGQQLLWFGHQLNLGEVVPYVEHDMPITYVTGPNKLLKNYIPWSVENLKTALSRSNIVIIPNGKKTRSNNRMVNAIAAGCFVLGGSQHKEWKHLIYSGPLHHGFQFANCFNDELNGLVKEAQKHVEATYSPKVIGQKWKEVCESI